MSCSDAGYLIICGKGGQRDRELARAIFTLFCEYSHYGCDEDRIGRLPRITPERCDKMFFKESE